MKFRILLFFLAYSTLTVSAQSLSYRKNKRPWALVKPQPIAVDPLFAQEDAVILDDTLRVAIGSKEVHRHVRIKFQTPTGVHRFNKMMLPEVLDVDNESLRIPIQKHSIANYTLGTSDYVVYFSARIIKPDGSTIPARIKDSVAENLYCRMVNGPFFYNFFFEVENILVGDELEVDYLTREDPYFTSFIERRIFFHSPIARQRYHFSIVQPSDFPYVFMNRNGSQPKDTIFNKKGTREWIWEFENMPAYGNLAGAVLYKELPHVLFYKHNTRFVTLNDQGTEVEKFSPYTWNYIAKELVGYRTPNPKEYESTINPSKSALNRLYAKIVLSQSDTSVIGRVNAFHETINETFDYKNDWDVYIGKDKANINLPKYLSEDVLRESFRSRVYDALLARMNIPYNVVYLKDKRMDEIVMNEVFLQGLQNPYFQAANVGRETFKDKYQDETIFNEVFLQGLQSPYFQVSHGGKQKFIRPKHHRFGHHMNEFPFYYEDGMGLVMPQNLPDQDRFNGKLPQVGFVTIPGSSEQDNVRNTSIRVAVSLGNNVADFSARVNLMGQYSTMMRGYYLKGYVDSSVSEKYHQRVCDIGADVNVSELEKVSEEKDFPFKTVFKSIYTKNKLLKELSPNEYALSMRNWFNHIIPDDFSAKGRLLSYYPDFKGTDTYKYLIEFDQPVTLLNAADFKTDIQNALGRLSINVEQYQANAILVESYFMQKTDRLPADRATEAEAIFTAIHKLNEIPLRVKK